MVLEIKEPDMNCYPFRRRRLYLAITVPYLAVLVSVFLFLLLAAENRKRHGNSSIIGILFLAFYLGMCYFQSYCCACLECPYVGEFCPAIAGIYPANLIARARFGDGGGLIRSRRKLKNQASMAGACWGCMMVLPLYHLGKRNTILAAGYALAHGLYYICQGLLVCPACSIRDTCPGGALQAMVLDRRGQANPPTGPVE